MSRIVQIANFVSPTSGGIRTTLDHLARGYAEAGHEVIQVLPAQRCSEQQTPWGSRVFLASTPVPGTDYRLLLHTVRVTEVLSSLKPDLLEVHDRTTLRGLGSWARRKHVPSLVVSHERLDRWLQQWLPPQLPLASMADRSNRALARSFDTVVCTTDWAAREFTRLAVDDPRIKLRVVPLGVDLDLFQPRLYGGHPDRLRLLLVSRLSKEKRPDLAVATVRELCRRGVQARLTVVGDGPMRAALHAQASGLPVDFLGFVSDRGDLAELMANADVVLAPGPVETFGLAALESLACGTPVVANHHSAIPEVIGSAGRSAAGSGFVLADEVLELLTVDEPVRRAAARSRAEQLPWNRTVRGFLAAHGLEPARLPVRVP